MFGRRSLVKVLLLAVLCALVVAPAAAQETVTLTVWDSWTREVESQVMETLNAEFEAAHPGVDVVREMRSYDDIRATIGRALSSGEGPDVSHVNQGRTDMQPLVEAGLLMDLGAYAEQYGWYDIMSPGIVARNSFSSDGQVFGEGVLYGVSVTAEYVGVYYNKRIFEANNVSVPQTFDEFEAVARTLRDAGIVPIVFGNLDAWPAIHTYSEIQNAYVTLDYLDDFIYGRTGVSFSTDENITAAAKLQDWVNEDFFTPQFEGIGYDDSWRLFLDGQGAMMLTGTWISGELIASENGEDFGFFVMPSREAGVPKITVGGSGFPFSIRQGTPNADLGAEYIDWLLSERAAQLWIEAGIVPLRPVDPATLEEGTLFTDIVLGWEQINSTNTVGHYLDWASPTMYNTVTASLQELLALRLTPQQFTDQISVDYGQYF